jgi:probable F420-dependent oxidoreductase
MRLETPLMAPSIQAIGEYARQIEETGYDSVITPEVGHDPFLPLMIVAEHTQRLWFGTGVAIAFPRSPFAVAIFNTFQTNERPNYKGKWYQFTLISPFFNPGPNPNGDVPIYISAVNKYNCRLVGELCDGIRMHGFNTPKYTREVIIPSIVEGAKKAGRRLSDIDVVGGSFLVTGKDEEEVEKAKAPVKQQIAFYGSTRSYLPVLECHGWSEVGMRLHRLSIEGKWAEMASEISDEMLHEFAIVGTYDEVVPKIKERYLGVVSTLDFGFGIQTPEQAERLRWMVQELRKP